MPTAVGGNITMSGQPSIRILGNFIPLEIPHTIVDAEYSFDIEPVVFFIGTRKSRILKICHFVIRYIVGYLYFATNRPFNIQK